MYDAVIKIIEKKLQRAYNLFNQNLFLRTKTRRPVSQSVRPTHIYISSLNRKNINLGLNFLHSRVPRIIFLPLSPSENRYPADRHWISPLQAIYSRRQAHLLQHIYFPIYNFPFRNRFKDKVAPANIYLWLPVIPHKWHVFQNRFYALFRRFEQSFIT